MRRREIDRKRQRNFSSLLIFSKQFDDCKGTFSASDEWTESPDCMNSSEDLRIENKDEESDLELVLSEMER